MEDNGFKRNKRYRQSIRAHEYRRNKDFAVGHKAFMERQQKNGQNFEGVTT